MRVTLRTEEIARADWRRWFDDFSRGLQATIATVEVDGPELGAQIEAQRAMLMGVSYDDRDDVLALALRTDDGGDVERLVSAPQRVYVGSDEHATVLDVEDADGVKTIVRMERAATLPPPG